MAKPEASIDDSMDESRPKKRQNLGFFTPTGTTAQKGDGATVSGKKSNKQVSPQKVTKLELDKSRRKLTFVEPEDSDEVMAAGSQQ